MSLGRKCVKVPGVTSVVQPADCEGMGARTADADALDPFDSL
jgi:hypothetical protein